MQGLFVNRSYVDYAIPNTPIEIFGGLGYGTYRSELSGLTNAKISPGGFIFTGTSTYAPVWQARLGATYNFNENFQFFAAYRYFDGDKLKFTFNLPNGIEFHAGPKEVGDPERRNRPALSVLKFKFLPNLRRSRLA